MRVGLLSPLGMAAISSGSVVFSTPEEIAQELVSPTKLTHVFVLGDSRLYRKQSNLINNCTSVVWGGADAGLRVSLTTAGHTSYSLGHASSSVTASTVLSGKNVNEYAPWEVTESEFTGSNEGGSGTSAILSRLSSSPFTQALFGPLWTRWDSENQVVTARQIYAKDPTGMSADPGFRISWLANGTSTANAGNYQGSFVYDVTGTFGTYGELSVSLPDSYDWATYTTAGIDCLATAGGSTTASEVALLLQPWAEGEDGAVLHMWATAGRTLTQFVTDSLFADEMHTVLMPLYGENRTLWIDLGTNGTGGVGESEHKDLLDTLIGKFRAGSPRGEVLITTAYPTRGYAGTAYYASAAQTVASETAGVLLLDTHDDMPSLLDAGRLGYYNVDEYSANGAQSSGSGTFVVNEAIDGGTPASGDVHILTAAGYFESVAYSSWSGSTFTLATSLPSNVSANAAAFIGDVVHYDTAGETAWAEKVSELVDAAAGTAIADAVSWAGDDGSATITSGEFETIPNQGSLGGNFTTNASYRPDESTLNSLACPDFGNEDYMVSSLAASTWNSVHNGTGKWTFTVYCRPDTLNASNTILQTFDGLALSSRRGFKIGISSGGAITLQFANGTTTLALNIASAAGVISINNDYVVQLRVEGAYVRALVNGTEVCSGVITTPSASDAQQTLAIGYQSAGSFSFDGKISEVRAQNAALTIGQMAALQAELEAKWAA